MPSIPVGQFEAPTAARLSGTVSAVHDSVEMSRLLLGLAADGGADGRALARQAELPTWLMSVDRAMVDSAHHLQLWELLEHALQDPYVGLTAVTAHQIGDLDLYDYLFTTAATVREALQMSMDFFHLVSTNCSLRAETTGAGPVTYSYAHALPGGRGEELWTQFSIAGFCARISTAAGCRVVPEHVAFVQPPPRSHRAFIDTFGTRRIDFAAPATTFTLRARDLDLPLPGADPTLARILRRYAATQPRPRPIDLLSRVRQILVNAIDQGPPSLETLARHLSLSSRTLQRRLSEHGTTWRAELEIARQHRAHRAYQGGALDMNGLARHLGYSDPRSVRRALKRWNTETVNSRPV